MPRTAPVHFEGARYHVINHGNHSKDLFHTHKSGEAFIEVLFTVCDSFGWKLHAYVLMSNHVSVRNQAKKRKCPHYSQL